MSSYFKKFRSIQYDGKLATNLMARLRLTNEADASKLYYTYEVKEFERPDHIAYEYYNDPKLDWLVYLSNKIKDPYFEWLMDTNTFENFIIQKYGSKEYALKKILFWKVNWFNNESFLSLAGYTSLPASLKKYWAPLLSDTKQIIGYNRKELHHAVDTNKIVELTCTISKAFTVSEVIEQYSDASMTTVIAKGQVVSQQIGDATTIVLNNVTGEFVVNPYLQGVLSGVTGNCLAVTTKRNNFTGGEAAYWSPVTAYEYEMDLNESHRSIYLIDKRYVNQIEREYRQLLS